MPEKYDLAAIKRPADQTSDTDEAAETDQIPTDHDMSGDDDRRESDEVGQPPADAHKRAFGKDAVNVWTMRLLWFNHVTVFLLLVLTGFGSVTSFQLDVWVQGTLIATTFGITGTHVFRRALASLFS